ncbi:VOC family protein [Bibersteinia trehalosi]|uniref:VOC family protein n=1 Tax=Bibersteinia trehalosi TaxID=47735 RepID=UPI002D76A849|nr:VOC family protein [Bibersteinia trehalosi]
MIQENAEFSHKLTACFGNLAEFEQKIQQIAEICGIDLSQFEIDHLAVRMNQLETAKIWREMLLTDATILKESEVNGRLIGLFILNQPPMFCEQSVSIIELPFPKGKNYPQEGWEHIEIVVPMQENESVELWIERCCKRWNLQENLQIHLKISQPQVAGELLPNPSIAISLNKEFYNFCVLKLHPYSIQEICRQN